MIKDKEPKKDARGGLRDLREIFHPGIAFQKCANELAKFIAGIDAEGMAVAMAHAGDKYLYTLEGHWNGEGKPGAAWEEALGAITAADELIAAINKLGPLGRKIIIDGASVIEFNKTPHGEWLSNVSKLRDALRPKSTEIPARGRPKNSTRLQRLARLDLLFDCCQFLEKFKDSDAFLTLVPEMARAVHRITVEPNLPKNSQKFRNEWEGRSTV